MKKTFHWLLVLSILIAFASSDYIILHILTGVLISILIIYRLIQSILKDKYYTLHSIINKKRINKTKFYILILLITIILTLLSGFIGYFFKLDFLIWLHREVITNLLIVAIILHIADVILTKKAKLMLFNNKKHS